MAFDTFPHETSKIEHSKENKSVIQANGGAVVSNTSAPETHLNPAWGAIMARTGPDIVLRPEPSSQSGITVRRRERGPSASSTFLHQCLPRRRERVGQEPASRMVTDDPSETTLAICDLL